MKSHDPVLKIRVISTCKFEFSKSWKFTYKAMALYAAENGISNVFIIYESIVSTTIILMNKRFLIY